MTFHLFICYLFAMLGLSSMATAHIKMSSPVPFNVDSLDNSPLDPSGNNYPCKVPSGGPYKVSSMNVIPVNKPVLLSFDGSAIHGTGTCQLAISLDPEPNANSVFKVIQVFQGGCPTQTGGGLTWNIPEEFPSAERATFAFFWNNRIGNREAYMNCAPIQITGGLDNSSTGYFDSLPDLFKANIPPTDCTTTEGTDPVVPNPGQFVLDAPDTKPGKFTGPKCGDSGAQGKNKQAPVTNLAAFTPPTTDSNKIVPVGGGSGSGGSGSGGSAAPSQPPSGGNSGAYGGGSNAGNAGSGAGQSYDDGQYRPSATASQPASSPAASAPAAPTSYSPPANQATSSALQTTLQTKTSSAAGNPYPYPTLSPTSGAGIPQPSGPAAPSSGMPSSSANSTSGTGSGTCSQDGAVVCNGSDQFGLCNHGKVVWQTVAAGTKCNDGVIEKRDAAKLKRHAHVGRHAHGMRL